MVSQYLNEGTDNLLCVVDVCQPDHTVVNAQPKDEDEAIPVSPSRLVFLNPRIRNFHVLFLISIQQTLQQIAVNFPNMSLPPLINPVTPGNTTNFNSSLAKDADMTENNVYQLGSTANQQ